MTTAPALPETSEELEELLADDKRREQVFASQESAADFLKTYQRLVNKARPDIQRQIDDAVTKGMRAFLIEAGVNRPDMSVPEAPHKGAGYNKRAPGAVLDKEFSNTADFLSSLCWNLKPEGQDRWRKIRNDYSSIDSASGGFLVPEVLRAEILKVALETAVVRPRARVIPMDSARVPFPIIDSTSNASTVYGGISAAWTEEGGTIAESEARFGRIVLQASKLASRCDVPNELLMNSIISFEAFINQMLPAAISWFEDTAFLTGHGAGQPLGILDTANTALVSVAKESGQAADTILWENIIKMYARMLPASLGSAVWVANIDTFPQLATMSLAVGTGGAAIWLNNGVEGPPMTILGRPVIFTEKVPTVGGGGAGKDIGFYDFSYYLVGDRQQMRAESSAHAQFTSDQTVYRIIEHVDGRPWIQSAITPQNGTNTLSPFVTIDERG